MMTNKLVPVRAPLYGVCALCVCCGLCAVEEETNQTAVREYLRVIPSIAGDIRRDMVLVPPAMPMPSSNGSMRLLWRQDNVWREPDGNSAYSAGEKDLYDLIWRPTLGGSMGVTTEFKLGLAQNSSYDNTTNLRDLEVMVFKTITHGRYSAFTLGLGTTLNMDDSEDMDEQHAFDLEKPGVVVELRGVTGRGMWVWASNMKVTYVHEAQNNFRNAVRMDDNKIVTGTYAHHYFQGHVGTGTSYRFAKFMRWGLEATATYQNWNGQEDLRGWKGTALLFTEISPGAGFHITLAGGIDPFDQDQDSNDDDIFYALALTKTY
jgi:hypothetical protein